MTYAEKLKTCKTPQEALLLLALALDEIEARIGDVDPWQQPLEWAYEVDDVPQPKSATDRKALIAEVNAQIERESDPDELRALHAKLGLLKNPGSVPIPKLAEGKRAKVVRDDVVLEPVSPERQEGRRRWAKDIRLGTEFLKMDDDAAADAFAKGGPRWLYYGNRDAVMAMPYHYRVTLVEDVANDSPKEAFEISRDILKAEEGVSEDYAVNAIDRLSEDS